VNQEQGFSRERFSGGTTQIWALSKKLWQNCIFTFDCAYYGNVWNLWWNIQFHGNKKFKKMLEILLFCITRSFRHRWARPHFPSVFVDSHSCKRYAWWSRFCLW